jgi:hypothetical protein
MKRFGKFRDPRFALTTLQNPSWEVRTRAELIQAAQNSLTQQPDAADFPFAGRPAAPGTPPPATTIPPPVPAAPLAAAEPQPQAQSALESEPEPEQHPEPETQPEPELEPELEPEPEPHPNQLSASDVVPITLSLPQTVDNHSAKPKRKYKPRPKRQPQPLHFSKIIPGLDAAEYVAESLDLHAKKTTGPHPDKSSALPELKRHARKCAICHHPDRADLEEAFVCWRSADLIQQDYDLPNYHTIYRHARALGLYERRRQNLRFAAELLIEHADQAQPDANIILRAIHACARINDRGEWVEPARRLIVTNGNQQAALAPAPEFQPPSAPDPRQFAPEPHEFAPETLAHAQFSAPVSSSTDGGNPQFLINGAPIRK